MGLTVALSSTAQGACAREKRKNVLPSLFHSALALVRFLEEHEILRMFTFPPGRECMS